MVAQLNKLVAQKKKRGEDLQNKADLLAAGPKPGKGAKGAKGGKGGAAGGDGVEMAGGPVGAGTDITSQMTTQQLVSTGRKTMSETEKSIQRSARVVEDTIAIGQQTAAMLSEQTHQMEKIMNDLDEITFSMKKAQKLLRDITRCARNHRCCVCMRVRARACLRADGCTLRVRAARWRRTSAFSCSSCSSWAASWRSWCSR